MNRPPPPDVRAAAVELARTLRAMAGSPQAAAVMRGLERALPEAAAEVREALENPGVTIGRIGTRMLTNAALELGDADSVIARGIGALLGKPPPPKPPRAPRKRKPALIR